MYDQIALLCEMSDKGVGTKLLALIGEPFLESLLVLKLHFEQLGYLLDCLEKHVEIPAEGVGPMVVLLKHVDPKVGLLESVQRRFDSVEPPGTNSHRQRNSLCVAVGENGSLSRCPTVFNEATLPTGTRPLRPGLPLICFILPPYDSHICHTEIGPGLFGGAWLT